MKLCLLILLFVLIFAGCSKHKQIRRIDFASGGTIISIDSSLNYNYFHCGRSKKLYGYYKGKITPALWDSLNIKLDSINFDTLKSVDCRNEFDAGVEILIEEGGKRKHFISNITCLPIKIKSGFYWIANTHNYVKLTQIRDPIKFNITGLCPPIEKEHHIKFPPAIKHSSL